MGLISYYASKNHEKHRPIVTGTKIHEAGNVIDPALLVLIQKGYRVCIQGLDVETDSPIYIATNADDEFSAYNPITLLGIIIGVASPRVGLMSIGEEESKGNELTKEVHKALKQFDLNFIGNVEGRDIYNGRADVIVCDGFTGNVALKTSEGLIEAVLKLLKDELSRNLQAKLGVPSWFPKRPV